MGLVVKLAYSASFILFSAQDAFTKVHCQTGLREHVPVLQTLGTADSVLSRPRRR
jgi:hypothetical protein